MKITGQFNLLSYNINTELFSSIIKFGHKKEGRASHINCTVHRIEPHMPVVI